MSVPVYPCLWFDGNAEEASDFYCSVFHDSHILSKSPMVVMFELRGSQVMALNGGPYFRFNEAISLVIECETQEEIDHYWKQLTENGAENQCGWVKDKFGVSWQIVPSVLSKLLNDANAEKSGRALKSMLQMKKLDIAELLEAFNGA